MGMTIKLAWRNIWRNKRRSGVILTAIVVGLLGMVFMIAIMDGMSTDMVEVAIENGVGHAQIHRQGFLDNMSVKLNIRNPGYVIKRIEDTPDLTAYAERVKVRGLISSAESSSGVLIWGVDHEREPKLNSIEKNKDEGEFLTGGKGEVYIGRSLAEKLKVGLDDKIVLRGQGLATEIVSAAFRVKGIFVSTSPEYDKYNVYINLTEAQRLFDMNGRVSEIALMSDSLDNVDLLAYDVNQEIGIQGLKASTWKEIIPLIVQMVEMFSAFNYIVFIIVVIAMAFGIVNTILMSVLERTREIGIIMAIGTRPIKVFGMVMWEGFFMGLMGLVFGWMVSIVIYAILSKTGIDFSIWSDSLKYMGGIGTTVYPIIKVYNVFWSSVSVFIAAVVSALYPAVKIMRLTPVKAFRSV
jgi:ABC-type lipoprotein release transport system permease subunit